MKSIVDSLSSEFKKIHANFRTISIHHLEEIHEELQQWKYDGLISETFYQQNYGYFRFQISEEFPDAQSIIIIAVLQKIQPLVFLYQGKQYNTIIPPTYVYTSIKNKCKDILTSVLHKTSYSVAQAKLPLKLLAVRSGLGRYGKNNICYMNEMGSFVRLEGFYSTYRFPTDDWQEKKMMERCVGCSLCQRHCPTQCIPTDRFLIHADQCLTYFNENEGTFPSRIDPHWHNALVGCVRCQFVCPMNQSVFHLKEDPVTFSEEETTQILNNTPRNHLSKTLSTKLITLNMDEYYSLLSRNLSVLINK